MSGQREKVYHYTDQRGKEAIERTGRIEPSRDGAYGPGVYFTSMPPTEGRKAVSKNNWDGGWNARESRGRADHAIEVAIPTSKLRDPGSGKRDVLVHDGPVRLGDYKWKAMSK
eukprot:TRINITY_DN17038_c1_g1_i3.p1 TRINITY_DN17038_c1_g1~~TRINITY_DN17038_c1_g1_i3.p1  ORF type:complete len:113 (+),score=16.46 TRINITY_DN17038_c1_g1_i3:282-620(+)